MVDCSVLLIGDSQRPEFLHASTLLARPSSLSAQDLSTAIESLADRPQPPELIVLLQSWPGEFDPRQFQALRRLAPLAGIVAVLGSWCEGETRSGDPLPGTTRIHWHEWPARFALEEPRVSANECPLWALPATATDEDRLLWSAEHPQSPDAENESGPRTVGILTHGRATWDCLSDACRQLGHQAIWLRSGQPAPIADLAAILWDRAGDPLEDSQLAAIIAAQSTRPYVVALSTFPRAEDKERLHDLGVIALIGKPFRLDELSWFLRSNVEQMT